ncbi:MAG: hypothetical protein RR370_01930 [Synergistaceae bacterium]
MASKAQGQFTIIDYNDAVTLTGYIGSNHAKTQMFNPDNDSYTPNWATNNLILTPSIYVIGTVNDKITTSDVQSVKWYEGESSTPIASTGNYTLSGIKSHILTVKANTMAGLPGKDYRCEVTYKDPTTGLSLVHKMSISLSRVINGGGITDLIVITPEGNVFKNGEVQKLSAKAELWRGSTIDTTSVSYQWYMMDSTIVTDQGCGIGWKKLVDAAGCCTGCTSDTLIIYQSVVDSYAVFKCIATDTDPASATKDKAFVDTASVIDNSDPLQIVITSTGGDIFKNGKGSTTLKAVVYQAGIEIDEAGTGTYTWTKYTKDAAVDTGWGTAGKKTGKTLTVGTADVAVKATFMCEASI